jgi:hypothetical protein
MAYSGTCDHNERWSRCVVSNTAPRPRSVRSNMLSPGSRCSQRPWSAR